MTTKSIEAKELTILHIEDELLIRTCMARILTSTFNAKVVSVGSGEDALQALQEDSNYDVIISDWDMPGGVNGGDVFSWIREHRPQLLSRFIFVSGNGDAEQMCSDAGIPYLRKPAEAHMIRGMVHVVLENAQVC